MVELVFSCIVVFWFVFSYGYEFGKQFTAETNSKTISWGIFKLILWSSLLFISGFYNEFNWPQFITISGSMLGLSLLLWAAGEKIVIPSKKRDLSNYCQTAFDAAFWLVIYYCGGLFDFIFTC